MQALDIRQVDPAKLRKFNNYLSLFVVCLSLYVITAPLLPNLTYKYNQLLDHKAPLVRANQGAEATKTSGNIPEQNTLVLPSINLQKLVFEGTALTTLEKGIWRRPNTSSPDKGGNTVLAGHRYGYNGDGVFYHLDKVHTGDNVVLYWQQKKYVYKVTQVKVVPPTDISVEGPSEKTKLTIYTCTPMWSFKDRLVVVAEEVNL